MLSFCLLMCCSSVVWISCHRLRFNPLIIFQFVWILSQGFMPYDNTAGMEIRFNKNLSGKNENN